MTLLLDGKKASHNDVQHLANKLIRTNATLRHEEWKLFDDVVIKVARQRLNAVADLQEAGLTKQLGGLGVMVSSAERSTDLTDAEVSMDGMTRSQNDRPEFDLLNFPVPIEHKDFMVNLRQLEASRTDSRGNSGRESLDTTMISMATRKVSDSLESMVFNGFPTLQVEAGKVFGYRTHPSRQIQPITNWAVKSGRDVIGDTKKMLDKLYAINRFGPFNMYVAKNLWGSMQEDYNDVKSGLTFKQRIEAFEDITRLRPGDSLADSEVIIVQMDIENVDLGVGQDIVNIEDKSETFMTKFKVFAAMTIRLKPDANNSLGVVHGSI